MPKGYPTIYFDDSGHTPPDYVASAVDCKFSELADLMWESLKKGEKGLEDKHAEIYVEQQIEFFESGWINPRELFFKLGKPAQMKLIQENGLEKAVLEYEKRLRTQEEGERQSVLRHQALLEDNRKESVIKKQIRETDKMQCVFCGHVIGAIAYCHYRYLPLGEQDEHKVENGFLSCKKCLKKGLEPTFGRFLTGDNLAST